MHNQNPIHSIDKLLTESLNKIIDKNGLGLNLIIMKGGDELDINYNEEEHQITRIHTKLESNRKTKLPQKFTIELTYNSEEEPLKIQVLLNSHENNKTFHFSDIQISSEEEKINLDSNQNIPKHFHKIIELGLKQTQGFSTKKLHIVDFNPNTSEFNGQRPNHFVFDLERGQFWNQNEFGYTSDIQKAGRFYYDRARDILKNSIMHSPYIDTVIVDAQDQYSIDQIKPLIDNPPQLKKKKSISDICADISENIMYYETNPYSRIVDEFEKNGWFVQDEEMLRDVYLGYGENKKLSLDFINNSQSALISITRLDSGRYETVAYSQSKPKNKI